MKEKWYEDKLEVVIENNKFKILWVLTIKTDHEYGTGKKPDVIVIQKHKNLCQIIDFDGKSLPLRWKS